MITEEFSTAVKDTMATVIYELNGFNYTNEAVTSEDKYKQIRTWLDTVKTKEDFFGDNRNGLNEYNTFIATKEAQGQRAKARSKNIHTSQTSKL
jgi:hypothetical protein